MPSWLQNRKDKSAKNKGKVPAQSIKGVAPAIKSAPVTKEVFSTHPVTKGVTATQTQTGIDPKTVAVIMAAVAAQSGKPIAALRFTAIRREGPSLWAASGREKIIHDRQSFV